MLEGIVITGGSIFLAIIGLLVRTEHRLTRLETKVDLLLNRNKVRVKKKL
jgi:hypothetical protein